ncbi:TPA: hypothetical protein ACWZYM_005254, partial [Enterobacter kobei]
AEFTVGEGKLMTHDEPCSMAPDDKHDLISGTCSHLPLLFANSNFSCSGFYMEIMATIILLGADQNFSDLFGNWLTFSACSSPCLDSF